MSLFPEIIRINVYNEDTKMPVPDIAIIIKLFASQKNDYHFLLPLSDEYGYVKITKDWLINKINNDRSLFIMDYSSTLDDCLPQIRISVIDTEQLARTVDALIRFKDVVGTSEEEIIEYKNACNSKYLPCVKNVKLDGATSLDIDIPLKVKME